MPATTQASAETRPSRMPMSAAVSPSSAEARIATPQLEYLKARKNSTMRMPATMVATRRFWLMPTSPTRNESPPHGWGTLRMSEPIRRISSVRMMMSTPIVTIARLITGAPRSRLMISRSMTNAGRGGEQDADEHGGQEAERVGQPRDRVGAEQQQRAVREAHRPRWP